LYFSTISDTQQQVTFVVYFLMMVFLLMSGLFTPVESMPTWAQNIDRFNPLFYFVRIMRGIVLKGAGISEIFNDFLALLAYAVGMFSLAIWRYRKTS
jgi:ABC-2 type transport system permease protein